MPVMYAGDYGWLPDWQVSHTEREKLTSNLDLHPPKESMDTAPSHSSIHVSRLASALVRFAIVLLLLGMLPVGMVVLAAAGSTLSNPQASSRVGTLIWVYLVADLVVLLALVRLHRRAWVWLVAASVGTMPMTVLLIKGWLEGSL